MEGKGNPKSSPDSRYILDVTTHLSSRVKFSSKTVHSQFFQQPRNLLFGRRTTPMAVSERVLIRQKKAGWTPTWRNEIPRQYLT
jgi:hypothetical protein